MAANAPLITSNYPDWFQNGRLMDGLINEAILAEPDNYSSIVKFRSDPTFAPGGFAKLGYLIDSGDFAEKEEAQDMLVQAPAQGFSKTIEVKTMSIGTKISYEAFDRDPTNQIRMAAQEIGAKYIRSLNKIAGEMYDKAYTGTAGSRYQSADGVYWFSDAHVDKSGVTQDNKLASTALTPTNLTTAMVKLRQQKNENQNYANAMGRVLLVGTDLLETGRKIVESPFSPAQVLSNELSNAINPLYGVRLAYNPHITATRWALIDDVRFDAHLVVTKAPVLEVERDMTKMTLSFNAHYYVAWGVGDFRGAVMCAA